MLHRFSRLAVPAALLLILAGCGQDADDQNAAAGPASPPAAEEAAPVPPGDVPAAAEPAAQNPVPPADVPNGAAPAGQEAAAPAEPGAAPPVPAVVAGPEPAAPAEPAPEAEPAPADQAAAAPAGQPADAGNEIATPPPAPASPMEVIISRYQLSEYYTALLIDANRLTDPHDMTKIALEICGDKELCQVGMWSDPEVTPQAMPVKVGQLKYELFNYGRNKSTGYEASLWNCTDYPEQEEEGCIPKPLR